ncbi:MAG: hypothetical protein LIO85_09130 [Rikenellaceae bacterium]|nr:hypothetical protein [Rikenellaceae bacterium]
MLENIISLVKDQVMDKLPEDADIPADKKNEVAKTTTTSIIEGLKNQMTPENISSLKSMLGGTAAREGDTAAIRENGITQGVESNVVSSLTSKTGLNAATATKIAALVVPAVIAVFARRTKSGGGSGFDIGSLVSAFTGHGSSSSSSTSGGGSGIMDMVGKFFNK